MLRTRQHSLWRNNLSATALINPQLPANQEKENDHSPIDVENNPIEVHAVINFLSLNNRNKIE